MRTPAAAARLRPLLSLLGRTNHAYHGAASAGSRPGVRQNRQAEAARAAQSLRVGAPGLSWGRLPAAHGGGLRGLHGGRALLDKKGGDDDATVEIETEEVAAKEEKEEAKEGAGGEAKAAEGDNEPEPTDPIGRLKAAIRDGKDLNDLDLEGMGLSLNSAKDIEDLIDALGDEDGSEEVFFTPGEKVYRLVDEEDDNPNSVMEDSFEPQVTSPRLAEESKELMYRLHSEDPKKHSVAALAKQFGVAPLRVEAILRMEKEVAQMVAKGMTPEQREIYEWGMEIEKDLASDHGTVKLGYHSEHYAEEATGYKGVLADVQERGLKARPRPMYHVVTTAEARKLVVDIQKWRKRKDEGLTPREKEEKRLHKAASVISTVEPMDQWHGVQPSASKRFKYVFADISKGTFGEKRWIAVRDTDGTLRAADYEERYRTERILKPIVLPRK